MRLSVPRAVVPLILEPVIASFCQAYPEIELEIAASEEMVDLAAGHFDAGIRLGQFILNDVARNSPPAVTPRLRDWGAASLTQIDIGHFGAFGVDNCMNARSRQKEGRGVRGA